VTFALEEKAKRMQLEGIPVISFGIGQPDFPTPDNIKQAGEHAIRDNRTGYTAATGVLELKQAIASKLLHENDLTYEASQIAVGAGGKAALYHLFLALLNPGDEVIILNPFWVSYPEQIRLAGGIPVFVGCDRSSFEPDIEALEKNITGKTKIIIVNSPNNPCGAVYLHDTLVAIAEIARQHDIFILSDEVYEHFYYGAKPVSIAALSADAYARTIVCNAVSKTYSMTGWRIGFLACADSDIIKAYGAIQGHTSSNPCSIAQYASVEAYQGDQESVGIMRATFLRRRDRMLELLKTIPGLTCAPPPGAFYCFPRYDLSLPSAEVAERILEEAHLVVVPGDPFGMESYIRLSYAVKDAEIEEGLERLRVWFSSQVK